MKNTHGRAESPNLRADNKNGGKVSSAIKTATKLTPQINTIRRTKSRCFGGKFIVFIVVYSRYSQDSGLY
jgi:hypothetical protein